MNTNDSKEIVGMELSPHNGLVELYHLKIQKPKDILKLKPKISLYSDGDWFVLAGAFGIFGALAKHFQNWLILKKLQSQFCHKDGADFGEVVFGEVGKRLNDKTDGDIDEFFKLLASSNWSLDELGGAFLVWLDQAGIDICYSHQIIAEYVRD